MIQNLIDELIYNIRCGNIVSFPTETVYALSCDANNKKSIDKIYEIKKRNKSKLFTIFIDMDNIKDYVYWYCKDDFVYDNLLNGNTIIFNKKENTIPFIGLDTIGIRYPKSEFIRNFLKQLSTPIVATSVNISGENPLCDFYYIKNNFKNIDFILDNNFVNIKMSGKPSKIISIVDNDIKVLRY